jgi:hypothetical protein
MDAPPNIIRVIKSRRMIWAGHAVHMGEIRKAYKFSLGDLDVRGRIILKWI